MKNLGTFDIVFGAGQQGDGISQQRFAIAGSLCILGALLTPSCCVGVPQLLSALGIFSAGIRCLFWLERLRPVFASVALISLAYEALAMFTRPASQRTLLMKSLFAASIVSCVAVMGIWIYLDIRYQ